MNRETILRLTGTYMTEPPVYQWEGTDRQGDRLITRYTPGRQWDVATYGLGSETSVTDVFGESAVYDMSEMFQKVRAAMGVRVS